MFFVSFVHSTTCIVSLFGAFLFVFIRSCTLWKDILFFFNWLIFLCYEVGLPLWNKIYLKLLSLIQESEPFEQTTASVSVAESESNEIQRFELLRKELIELEKRVQRSTDQSENEEVSLNILFLVVLVSISYYFICSMFFYILKSLDHRINRKKIK